MKLFFFYCSIKIQTWIFGELWGCPAPLEKWGFDFMFKIISTAWWDASPALLGSWTAPFHVKEAFAGEPPTPPLCSMAIISRWRNVVSCHAPLYILCLESLLATGPSIDYYSVCKKVQRALAYSSKIYRNRLFCTKAAINTPLPSHWTPWYWNC